MSIEYMTDADAAGQVVPLLEVRDATMRFGAVTALNGVSLTLNQGEILALLGDNGAGKSTMIKCISGVQQLTEGHIYLEGQPISPRSPKEARELGLETVYQDLALFDNLSAAQNMFAGREIKRPSWLGPLGLVDRKAMSRRTAENLARLQVGIHDPSVAVGLMSGGQRQAIAVARAETWAKRIVILDESRNVRELVRRLPQKGISVILISHNLEEVISLSDRAVVFRQGRLVGEVKPTAENQEQIVSMIVGATAPTASWT